jgi:hypothetical protein
MIAVFDEAQRRHAPKDCVVAGKAQPTPERPERIDMLLARKGATLRPVSVPIWRRC